MPKEFNLAQGIDVDELFNVHQCYEKNDNSILANISFENLSKIISDLCMNLKEPLFFFLEVPCDEETESKLRKKSDDPYHKDVYYLDNCTLKVILAIIKRYGDLLFNDGLAQFGFASHEDEDEIYVMKYKVLSIYSKDIYKYTKVFEKCNVPCENKIKTVWDVFSNDNIGTCTSVEFNGESIFDVIENLSEVGLYLSHQAIDN